jgi:hypothetical protein
MELRSTRSRIRAPWLALALLAAGCSSDDGGDKPSAVSTSKPAAPVRGAAGDEDLRVMLAQIASARACDQIKGHFQALPADRRPQVMTGALWIHGCRITSTGTKVKFRLEGNGWQWIDEEKKKAGATFSLRQYVRFGVVATITGTLDVAYDPAAHVASVWFTALGLPDVRFSPIGKLDVDREGAWSKVLGAAASLLASSPEESAKEDAQKQGATEFAKQLGSGLSVTIDLCTGISRTTTGHTPRGKMAPAGVGETKGIAVELQPGGVMIFGPNDVDDGLTIEAEVTQGKAHLALMCNEQAQALAKAFVAGETRAASTLAARDLGGKGTLHIDAARCPVSLVAQLPPDTPEAAKLTWRRPKAEATATATGPLIDCAE